MTIRTRFAPSPTGDLHIGGARTALFCWLHARRHGGTYVLRIEDTDRERSTPEAIQGILDGLAWLGLDADEGPYFQSERFDRYAEVLQQLRDKGHAYPCYCSREELQEMRDAQMKQGVKPRYDRRCRDLATARAGVEPVWRFRNPDDGNVVIKDLIRGTVSFANDEMDDLIVARSDGSPTYNFTVVVDDRDMQISHVIRGEDHLNNTPRQVNIYRALGAEPPVFAHVPLIHGEDGAKLSKRHGAVNVMAYREDGYLPEALLNYLVRLGWSHGDQEVFSREEMISLFDIGDVNRAASRFNTEKLRWLNQHYMRTLEPAAFRDELVWHLGKQGLDLADGPPLERLIEVQRERCHTLVEMAEISAMFFQDFDEYDEKAAKKNLRPVVLEPLRQLRERLAALSSWEAPLLHDTIEAVAAELELKLGKIAQPLRVAVSGGAVSPAIDLTLELVGQERTLKRLDAALAHIENRAAEGGRGG